jgi:calcineurin-like phosphoesterase family protein
MDAALVNNWNRVVQPEDVVWHLGDFAYKTSARYTRDLIYELHGKINVIAGNHDKLVVNLAATKSIPLSKFQVHPSYLELGATSYIDQDGETQIGPMMVLCHYPMRSWNQSHRGSILLYGHVHNTFPDYRRSTDIGVDKWNFTPVNMEEVLRYMDEKIEDGK